MSESKISQKSPVLNINNIHNISSRSRGLSSRVYLTHYTNCTVDDEACTLVYGAKSGEGRDRACDVCDKRFAPEYFSNSSRSSFDKTSRF